MPKRPKQSREDARRERATFVEEGLLASKNKTALSIFGDPTTEQVFMTFDLAIDETDSVEEAEEVVRDLKESVKIATKVWGDKPTEEQITGIYYRAFADDDEE
jgi:hypothetical protein